MIYSTLIGLQLVLISRSEKLKIPFHLRFELSPIVDMAALRYPASRALLRLQRRHAHSSSSQTARKYSGTAFHRSWHVNRWVWDRHDRFPILSIPSPRDHKAMRPFHESQKQPDRFYESSIDFAYMPQHTLEGAAPPEVMRIPLLPYNDSQTGREEAGESVIRPQISLVSANSTHIESPSAMSEVTDNHAADLDPFDLTNKVTTAASKIAEVPMERIREAGALRQLWTGLMDDLFGSKPISRA